MNARLSSMTPYMLCVSRFAHYVKVLVRDRIGSVSSVDELENMLSVFLSRYVTPDAEAPASTKARLPLREAKVELRPKPGEAGAYLCVMHLVPHYELDDMAVRVRLTTEVRSPRLR
jgi:type VI secretion system ImpC/EvpB family protein